MTAAPMDTGVPPGQPINRQMAPNPFEPSPAMAGFMPPQAPQGILAALANLAGGRLPLPGLATTARQAPFPQMPGAPAVSGARIPPMTSPNTPPAPTFSPAPGASGPMGMIPGLPTFPGQPSQPFPSNWWTQGGMNGLNINSLSGMFGL